MNLAPTPPPEVVEQTPEQPARPDSGDIANCQCPEPLPARIAWFNTSQCALCRRAIFRNGNPVRS